jgi:hypothetical protein
VFFVFFVVKSCVRQRGRQIAAAQTRKTELKPQMHADAAALHTPTCAVPSTAAQAMRAETHLRASAFICGFNFFLLLWPQQIRTS